MNLELLIKAVIALITPFLPLVGAGAEATAERVVTVPQADIVKLCAGMSPDDTDTAVSLGHAMAHSIAAFCVFVASRGKVVPS